MMNARISPDQFELVNVDGQIVASMTSVPSPTLRAKFGDYSRPAVQQIGVGDSVVVTIWEAGSSSLFAAAAVDQVGTTTHATAIPEQTVAEDGSIEIPYVGRLKVMGRTERQVGDVIVHSLKGKAIEPQALVKVTKSVSNTVSVTGDVTGGGVIPLSPKGNRILEVIAYAGGLRAPAYETFVTLARNGTTVTVPFSRITAEPTENVYVHPGDVITVLRRPQTFMVFGATGRNAEIAFGKDELNLATALGKAGGLLDYRADPSAVFLFRHEPSEFVQTLHAESRLASHQPSVPVLYRFDFSDPTGYVYAQAFPIHDGDLIYVSNAAGVEFQKVLQIFGSAAAPAASGTVLYTDTAK